MRFPSACVQIVALALSLTLTQEAINWVLTYRTSAYRGVKETLERATKRLDTIRATSTGMLDCAPPRKIQPQDGAGSLLFDARVLTRFGSAGNEKQLKKKEKHMDGVMKSAQKDLALIKMKSGAVVRLGSCFLSSLIRRACRYRFRCRSNEDRTRQYEQ
jgi:hypothetical protein